MRTCPRCQRTYPDDTDFCSRDGSPLPISVSATEADLAAGLARRYRIVRRLGAGGMGAVFLAEQVALGNRPVALKVLLHKLLDDPEFLERFHNEAASTARIRHPNVITVYESGQSDDGSPYIAMEYLEGENLRQALRARGAFPVAETAEILQQVARGLNAAHKLGIIHRDLKPDNIFLTRGDEGELAVKVMDFGIAKLRESATHTLTGTVLGTPAYMSFEQSSGMRSEELDLRSDIYSLGVVVYEMLTGRVPFHSDTPLGYVRKHMMEEPPPFHAVAPGLPVAPEVERAVLKTLKKDREERYASALEFALDLATAAQETLPVSTHEPFPSTKIVRPSSAPVTADAPTKVRARPEVEVAVQTPPPIPPRETAKPAPVPAQAAKPAPAVSHQPAVSRPPQFQAPIEQPSRAKFVVLGLILMAVIIGGFWYFLGRGERQQSSVINQPAETSKPPEASKSSAQPAAATAPPGMVAIPGGALTMGRDNAQDPEETPAHSVSVASFYLDKFPVTNSAYSEFVRATQNKPPTDWKNGAYPTGQDYWPVDHVSWNDAQSYCQWKGGRLPAEAEWEYAARSNDGRLYPWGNNFRPALTNSKEAGLRHPEPVGSHPDASSPFGVLDMSGNLWEWVEDGYKPYPGRPASFRIPEDAKVIRGGSYDSDKNHVTTTTRNLDHAATRSPTIGFRCAKSM